MVNLDEVVEGLDLSLLGRAAWERDQAVRDLELLWWIGRFRFVTSEAIGQRFEISLQRANSRVRRLEKLRLVETWQRSVCEPRAVFLTGRAMELLGQPRRRAPRPDVQCEHEAAIVWLSTQLEREQPAAQVWTERECRRRERAEVRRYSVEVVGEGSRGDRRRWPDLVVEQPRRRTAIEIEVRAEGQGAARADRPRLRQQQLRRGHLLRPSGRRRPHAARPRLPVETVEADVRQADDLPDRPVAGSHARTARRDHRRRSGAPAP